MPVTPFMTVPNTPRSQRNYASEECRENAQRIRRENDWFSHSDTPAKAVSPRQNSSPRYSNEQHRIERPSSAKWWNDCEVSRASRHDTPESRQIRHKLEAHNQQDWYKHGPGVPDPPSLTNKGPKSRRSACSEARARQASSDSNGWFKHDNNKQQLSPSTNGSLSTSPSSETLKGNLNSRKKNKDLSGSISWLMNDTPISPTASPKKRDPCPFEIDDGSPSVESPHKGRLRIISPDADCYQRRNHEGSASRWYAPKDNEATPEELEINHSRKAPIKYAFRLDAESEDWYSFRDASKSLVDLNNGRSSNVGVATSPGCDAVPKLSRFVANSSDELNRQTGFLSEMDLNKNGETIDKGRSATERPKWNQTPQGNGFKHFVRLDDYFEPTWSVMSDDVETSGDKL